MSLKHRADQEVYVRLVLVCQLIAVVNRNFNRYPEEKNTLSWTIASDRNARHIEGIVKCTRLYQFFNMLSRVVVVVTTSGVVGKLN